MQRFRTLDFFDTKSLVKKSDYWLLNIFLSSRKLELLSGPAQPNFRFSTKQPSFTNTIKSHYKMDKFTKTLKDLIWKLILIFLIESMRRYVTKHDQMWQNKTKQDHVRPNETKESHTGAYRTIEDHTYPCRTIRDHTGLYRNIQDHKGPYGPYGTKQVYTKPYGTILD